MSEIETTPTKDSKIIERSEAIEDDQFFANQAIKTNIARWYAIQVASSCEKKVKATLEQRAITLGVSDRIIEIEIPQTPAVKLKKDGSRQTTEEKVFPGYVLVRMVLDEDTMMAVSCLLYTSPSPRD